MQNLDSLALYLDFGWDLEKDIVTNVFRRVILPVYEIWVWLVDFRFLGLNPS